MIASPQIVNAHASDNAPGGTALQSDVPLIPSNFPPDWAHGLVLDMLKANLPMAAFAEHLGIPFARLMSYIRTPEVQAELDAYDQLMALRARLLGQTARPIAIRRLLDIIEYPMPQPRGVDSDADARAFYRHAELIRRTATTIARESRAMVPKPPRSSRRVPPVPAEPGAGQDQTEHVRGAEAPAAPDHEERASPPAPTDPEPTISPVAELDPRIDEPSSGATGSKTSVVSSSPSPTLHAAGALHHLPLETGLRPDSNSECDPAPSFSRAG